MLIATLAIVLAVIGNILFGLKTISIEKKENKTSVWPWVIFTLLGLNDFLLFIFSPEPTFFEILAGFIVFLGPFIISVLIIKQNIEKEKMPFSFLDKVFFFFSLVSILAMSLVEILVTWNVIHNWGDSLIEKYGFMCFVIILDLISVVILWMEIKAFPKDYEPWSWIFFLLASILATYYQIAIAGVSKETGLIPSIMIAENIFVAAVILPSVLFFRKKDL